MSKVTTMKYPFLVSDITGKSNYTTEIESINECLRLLLLSSTGELLGDPLWGCRLREYIFLPNIDIYDSLIKEEIIKTVAKYEKRIYLDEDYITIVREESTATIHLRYKIKSTGITSGLSLQLLEGE